MSERWVPLDVADCDANPFAQFCSWFDEAKDLMLEREAVALITASPDARPSARMVLLRHHDERSFGWFTNYESRKGDELTRNPHAALLWYCEPLGRQIRVEGDVTTMSAEQSDAYFASRPRASQIGARASDQSAPLVTRGVLEERIREIEAEFEGREVERPAHWGGYLLTPNFFEFWQHRQSRLHDRVFYEPEGAAWRRSRHAP